MNLIYFRLYIPWSAGGFFLEVSGGKAIHLFDTNLTNPSPLTRKKLNCAYDNKVHENTGNDRLVLKN